MDAIRNEQPLQVDPAYNRTFAELKDIVGDEIIGAVEFILTHQFATLNTTTPAERVIETLDYILGSYCFVFL